MNKSRGVSRRNFLKIAGMNMLAMYTSGQRSAGRSALSRGARLSLALSQRVELPHLQAGMGR